MGGHQQKRTELDEYERQAIDAVFKYYDKDNNGAINVKELEKGMRSVVPEAGDDILEIIDDLDADGDQTIDQVEFRTACTRLLLGHETYEDVARAFQYIDYDRNGFISPSELKKLLMTTGSQPLSLDEAEQLISWADVDGDGVLNYKEFTHFLCGAKSQKQQRLEEEQRMVEEKKREAANIVKTPDDGPVNTYATAKNEPLSPKATPAGAGNVAGAGVGL
jgi:Ca2+-binding EF-hand superfamily protein